MPKSARGVKTNADQRWWLSGDEQCTHCGQYYAYELGIYCVDCDGPGCPHCFVIVDERKVCLACAQSGDDDGG